MRHPESDSPADRVAELEAENLRLRVQLAEARRETYSWRVHVQGIAESRSVMVGRLMSRLFLKVAPVGSRRRRWSGKLTEGLLWVRRGGKARAPHAVRRYRQYYANTRPTPADLRRRQVALGSLAHHPTVAAIVEADGGDLAATLASLTSQVYDRVEIVVASPQDRRVAPPALLVVHDGPPEERVNVAAAGTSAEYVVVLRAGDILPTHALFDLVEATADADAAFSDEDRIDSDGERVGFHLKPSSLGPETLLSYDTVGAPLLVARTIFERLGGYDASCTPVASHDFSLRLSDATSRIAHVADVLLSRPAAQDPDPADAAAATVPVVTRALSRRGADSVVGLGEVLPSVRFTVTPPAPPPSVAIVIPSRDRLDLLRACVDSVESRSTYPNYTITLLDNDSKEPETLAWFDASPHPVVRCPGPFNYSAIVNRGVAHTDADFVVTLNNDTTIATPDWLERMVGLCALDGVGSVGVKLAYPDGRVQHEGVAVIPMPVHLSRDSNYPDVDRWLSSTRDGSAVTGACQMVRTEAWRAVGGLDERLAVAFNDVDFALRMHEKGWRTVYTPEVLLGHRESATRGSLHPEEDEALLIARWDLLGRFQDPTMPPAMRQLTTRVELDIPAP